MTQGKQLYQGCWLPVKLTKGVYAGSTLLFVAFWKEARATADYDTDNGDAYPTSFMNVYTGILGENNYDTHSAYSLSDLLNPAAAAGKVAATNNNYRIRFIKQFQSIGVLKDPQRWAKEIEVTIKANSQARYAMAAYAKRAGKTETIGIDQDLVFIIQAVSNYTVTTTISTIFGAPIYEGASTVINTKKTLVGSGWIEQMVDPSSHS